MGAAQHALGEDGLGDGVALELGRDALGELLRVDLLDLAVGGGRGVGRLEGGGVGLGGVVQTAVTQAARLETGEQPTIVINTENRKYLIKREENITTTIIKRI